MSIKKLRTITGMTQLEFANYFNIPKRTIENWESEKRTPPIYIIELIAYKIKMEGLNMKMSKKEINETRKEETREYRVTWCSYDQDTTEYGATDFDPETVEATSEEEAIELIKQWIFDQADKKMYPDIEITDTGIDLGNGTEYRCFKVVD